MNCPSCSQPQPDNSTECGGCGVIFAKWKARSEAQAAAPAAKSSYEPSGAQDASLDIGSVIKGAAVGTVASVIESMVVAIPFMKGVPTTPAQAEEMTKALMTSSTYLMTDLGASLLCMAIGGYAAAGSNPNAKVKNAGAAGVLMALVLAGLYFASPSLTPGWYTAAVFILIVPAAILGGLMR